MEDGFQQNMDGTNAVKVTSVPQKLVLPSISEPIIKLGLSLLGIILIVGSIGTAMYFYQQYRTTQQLLKNPSQASTAQVQSVVSRIGKLMELPTGEIPQLATVIDSTKLSGQPFFVRAHNGDAVLIYTKNRKAILYRPSENKIIEVAPLNLNNPAPQEQGNVAGVSTQNASPTPVKASPTPTPTHVRLPTPTKKP